MVTLFIMGALIGSGACLICDLAAQNKILKEKIKKKEDYNETLCKQ